MPQNKLTVTDILSTVPRNCFGWALLAHHMYKDDQHLSRMPRQFSRLNTCVSIITTLAASAQSTTHCLDHDYVTLLVTPVRCLAGARHASLTSVYITFEQPPSSDVVNIRNSLTMPVALCQKNMEENDERRLITKFPGFL